ncbi:MAG: class I SAM-dependent methyltransferase [Cyanobacteria bacterium J06600_6]
MSQSDYIFSDTQYDLELTRLQKLEQVYDPASCDRLLTAGITTGWQCLEIGAGAGSMMRWMSDKVGATGKVIAVDCDTRFIRDCPLNNVKIIEADILQIPLDKLFDLIHVRHVLVHLENQELLTKIWQLLKPGGWLVIEEADFSANRFITGTEAQQQSVEKVNEAMQRMFSNQGKDYALGIKLPSLLQQLGFENLIIGNDVAISAGNSDIATMMKLSARQLTDKYLATDL